MEKIKNYFRNYFKNSSWFKIATDIIFYLLLISLLIPSTRTHVTSLLIRTTLLRPKVINQENAIKINLADFQLVLEDMEGNTVNLADYSGRTIFVNFWATWCPPCRAEMPSMQELYNSYGEKLPIFLVTSEQRSKVVNYLTESGFDLPVYFQKSQAMGLFDVHSYPTSLLISESGEVLVNKKGAANWNSGDFRKKLDAILMQDGTN